MTSENGIIETIKYKVKMEENEGLFYITHDILTIWKKK